MQDVESYWDPVAGERSGCCSRLVGGAWTPERAHFCYEPSGIYVRCARLLRISAKVQKCDFLSSMKKRPKPGAWGGGMIRKYFLETYFPAVTKAGVGRYVCSSPQKARKINLITDSGVRGPFTRNTAPNSAPYTTESCFVSLGHSARDQTIG